MRLHPKKIDLTLGRVERLLAALGNPQDKLPPVIHVAGTNGKGSTVATMRACLEAAGYRVHVYTSPHLVRFHERIRLAGELIDEDALLAVLDECERANARRADHVFRDHDRGGVSRLLRARRPISCCSKPGSAAGSTRPMSSAVRRSTAITPISLDHQAFLGDTIAAIAGEKAGILKPGAPAVIGPQPDEAAAVIEARAAAIGAPLYRWDANGVCPTPPLLRASPPLPHAGEGARRREAGEGEPGCATRASAGGSICRCRRCRARTRSPMPGSRSPASNSSTGSRCRPSAIAAGLRQIDWPARLQRLTRGPLAETLPPGWELWLDGGHNPGAGQVLAEAARGMARPAALPRSSAC